MKKGVACILLSAFGFALMAMFVRLADDFGGALPAVQKAFFRNLVALVIASVALVRSRQPFLAGACASAAGWRDLVLRSLFGTLGILCNFHALSHIPLGDAMALNKTAPFFTLIMSWFLMGERMTARQMGLVALAFGGALLVVKPSARIFDFAACTDVASSIGLLSGFCAGTAYAFLHRLGRRGVNAAFIVFFFSLFSCLASVPFIVLDCHPMSMLQVAILCGAGAGAALGQFGITWAYRFAEPRQIAVYDYSGIVFAAILGFFAFGQIPDRLSFVGCVIIVAMAAAVSSAISIIWVSAVCLDRGDSSSRL